MTADEADDAQVTLRPDQWQRVVFAFEKQYCADDGTPPPSEWFFEIARALRQAAGTA